MNHQRPCDPFVYIRPFPCIHDSLSPWYPYPETVQRLPAACSTPRAGRHTRQTPSFSSTCDRQKHCQHHATGGQTHQTDSLLQLHLWQTEILSTPRHGRADTPDRLPPSAPFVTDRNTVNTTPRAGRHTRQAPSFSSICDRQKHCQHNTTGGHHGRADTPDRLPPSAPPVTDRNTVNTTPRAGRHTRQTPSFSSTCDRQKHCQHRSTTGWHTPDKLPPSAPPVTDRNQIM